MQVKCQNASMRRSAAPSQQGLAPKRPRFNPPFRSSNSIPLVTPRPVPSHHVTFPSNQGQSRTLQTASCTGDSEECSTTSVRETLSVAKQGKVLMNYKLSTDLAGKSDHQATQNNFENIPGRTSVTPEPDAGDTDKGQTQGHPESWDDEEAQAGHGVLDVQRSPRVDEDSSDEARPKHAPLKRGPLQRKPFVVKQLTPTVKPLTTETAEDDDGPKHHYYSVMWCKLSKKKHKKWEGDALLITKGRSVTLLDIEGKEIGKGSGYRPSELESMEEGHTLCVGGKEIEVMGSISEEDWTTGKCFQTGSSSTTSASHGVPLPSRGPRPSKPFANPQKTGTDGSSSLQTKVVQPRVPRPLYDPTHPDALVMPRPPSSHQWQNNPKNESIVDVVVDPHLASKLRPHQREGVLFLYECIMGLRQYQGQGAILADEMGLGKTLQCITLIWTLFKQGPYGGKPIIKKVLIVTPGSLVKNWCREFRKWLGSERISVFPVSSDKKVEEFKKSPLFPVMVISYEMMVRYTDDIRGITFDLVVCDEGHRLKNSTIKTASFLSSLTVRRRILLTGTPIQNDLQEFYSIVEFCNPGVLGTSASFHRVYEEPILRSNQPSATKEEKVLGAARAAELSRLTSLFVLRRTQEINNKYLPPKVETVVFCEPSPLQLHLYQHLLRSPLIRSCLSRGYTPTASASSPHLVCIGALKKLCNDPSLLYKASQKAADGAGEMKSWMLDDDEEEEESLYKGLLPIYPSEYSEGRPLLAHCGKLHVLSEMLKGMHADQTRKERLVLVSNYTQTLDILQALCSMEGYRFCRLDGSTPTTKRQSIVEHFNSSYAKETIFLLSSKAGGVGLNLIGASRLLLYDIDWNPANDLQAMARVWRDGQKKTVRIYRLITAGTIEEKIYQRQISKQSLSGAVVDAKGQGGSVKFSLEELRDLFTLHEGSSCITHDMLDCDCTETDRPTSNVKSSDNTQRDLLRPCQLGRPQPPATKKNLSMGDLNEWHHYPAPLSEDFQDEYLLEARDRITFVFQNETNMVPVS